MIVLEGLKKRFRPRNGSPVAAVDAPAADGVVHAPPGLADLDDPLGHARFGHPVAGLTLNGGLIYDVVKYPGNYNDEYGNSLAGQQLIYAPKWKFTFTGEYERPINDHLDWFASGSAVYKRWCGPAQIYTNTSDQKWTIDRR